ncbi:MAG: hypothetical protein Q9213_003647 [Squamulea squamosa]
MPKFPVLINNRNTRAPGSAYVVIPELSAVDVCGNVALQTSQTLTFAPGQLSTVDGYGSTGTTKVFDWEDYLCAPPDPLPTIPRIAPFSQLFDADTAFQHFKAMFLTGRLLVDYWDRAKLARLGGMAQRPWLFQYSLQEQRCRVAEHQHKI